MTKMRDNKLFLLKNFLTKPSKSKLRRIIRGHARLKDTNKLDKIHNLKRELATYKLKILDRNFSSLIMGDYLSPDMMEQSIRQYLLTRLANYTINEQLILNLENKNHKIVYPLPKEWITILENNDFRVAKKLSAIYWHAYLIALVGYSFLLFIKILFRSILTILKSVKLDESYIYFSNLTSLNIPKANSKHKSYDVISWFLRHSSNKSSFKNVKHDAKKSIDIQINGINIYESKNGPIPNLNNWKCFFIFLFWGISVIMIALADIVRGKWWHSFILNQAILAKQASLLDSKFLAKEYFFHNTNQTYRPLWTYVAEKNGSKITLYFYSTNIETLNINPTYYWKCMSWPMYLVWDKYQSKFLERSLGSPQNAKIVGPIWWSDNADSHFPNISSDRTIAIFGVTPHRHSRYCLYAEEIDYVVPETCNRFIQDILDAAEKLNMKCLIKEKRDLTSEVIHPKYNNFLKKTLENNNNITLIDSEVAPNRMINYSSATISLPFTAPAIIAKEMGKPSCYYDPTGMLNENHHGSHGVTLVNNKEDLYNWIKLNCS